MGVYTNIAAVYGTTPCPPHACYVKIILKKQTNKQKKTSDLAKQLILLVASITTRWQPPAIDLTHFSACSRVSREICGSKKKYFVNICFSSCCSVWPKSLQLSFIVGVLALVFLTSACVTLMSFETSMNLLPLPL